jgi:hypothetical protein
MNPRSKNGSPLPLFSVASVRLRALAAPVLVLPSKWGTSAHQLPPFNSFFSEYPATHLTDIRDWLAASTTTSRRFVAYPRLTSVLKICMAHNDDLHDDLRSCTSLFRQTTPGRRLPRVRMQVNVPPPPEFIPDYMPLRAALAINARLSMIPGVPMCKVCNLPCTSMYTACDYMCQ